MRAGLQPLAARGKPPLLHRVVDEHRGGRHDGDHYPHQQAEEKSAERDRLQRYRDKQMTRVQFCKRSLTPWRAVNNSRREQKSEEAYRKDAQQQHVYAAVQTLTGTAMVAVGQVRFVVRAGSRRNLGQVVSPAGEDRTDDPVVATLRRSQKGGSSIASRRILQKSSRFGRALGYARFRRHITHLRDFDCAKPAQDAAREPCVQWLTHSPQLKVQAGKRFGLRRKQNPITEQA